MRLTLITAVVGIAPFCLAQPTHNGHSNWDNSGLTVRTKTGIFTGLQNTNFTGVREFRNIPFALPPTGSRRFMPPESLPHSDEHHYSYRYPPSCPQFVSSSASFWNLYADYLLIDNGLKNHFTGATAESSSEDCLNLAIWTPLNVSANANLPVAFFMTGGGFSTGGIQIPGQIPAPWVNRTQAHIVVTINYRVNIFGFPNSAGSNETPNVGILDQRMALEWVATNIASFGGDPSRIMMWGQSAGSQSADYHNYAFWENPISHASFSQSGTALKGLSSSDAAQTNFSSVALALGCEFPSDKIAELACMQQVPMQMIVDYLNSGHAKLSFGPIADEVLIFSDYPARAKAGKISSSPAIFSDASNNDASLTSWPVTNVAAGPNETSILKSTLAGWVCPTANSSILRHDAGRITYRYQYAGNFSNETPYSWLAACHSSDLTMNFGTYFLHTTNATDPTPTPLEVSTSEAMQDFILAFMSDPVNGPPAKGWLPYTYGSNVLRFGADGIAVQNVTGYEIDGPCFENGTYNPLP